MAAKKSGNTGSRGKSSGSGTARVLLIGVIVGFILGFASHWIFSGTISNIKEYADHVEKYVGKEEKKLTEEELQRRYREDSDAARHLADKAKQSASDQRRGTSTSKTSPDSKYKPLKVDPQTEAEWSFHELLEEKVDSTPSATKPNGSTTGKSYVMGCAAFSAQEKAESMKAQIAFAGLQAEVKPVTSKTGARLFRVQLGPYSSKAAAEADRKKLADAGVSTCQIW